MKGTYAAEQRLKAWHKKQVGKVRIENCARSRLPKTNKQVAAGADSDGGSRQGHNASRRRSVAEERLAQVLAARRKRQEDKL